MGLLGRGRGIGVGLPVNDVNVGTFLCGCLSGAGPLTRL